MAVAGFKPMKLGSYSPIKVGDTLGLLPYQVLENGLPFDLGTPTSIVFRMTLASDPSVVIVNDAAGALFTDGSDGMVVYQRVAGDVAVAGEMICEHTVVLAGGFRHVSPSIRLLIQDDV